jgi:hypothetical protein
MVCFLCYRANGQKVLLHIVPGNKVNVKCKPRNSEYNKQGHPCEYPSSILYSPHQPHHQQYFDPVERKHFSSSIPSKSGKISLLVGEIVVEILFPLAGISHFDRFVDHHIEWSQLLPKVLHPGFQVPAYPNLISGAGYLYEIHPFTHGTDE